jgi:diguanylate cyclase (GGDEF)-like protein
MALMTDAAPLHPSYPSGDLRADVPAVPDTRPASVPLRHRLTQRRRTYLVHCASYGLGAIALLVYAWAGTIAPVIAAAFFLSGAGLIGVFIVLSEAGINDRFDDHYLTVFQIGGHAAIQLVFVTIAPQIGYAFLCVLFLIFAFGSLRMTARQATLAWTVTMIGLAAIFVLTDEPIGMATTTRSERGAALLCLVLTIGQCAFIGLYGSSLRKTLFRRSFELKEAYRRIEELADLDELTGAFNRRRIMNELEDEIARARRTDTPCTVALIDLDWFKRINDSHGHPVGDEVLRTFAITMFANIRAADRFGRYGGEEFLLIAPGTTEDATIRSLNRLRAIIAGLDWSAFSSDMAVTISAGVATLRHGETTDALLARADKALYLAKESGRNQVVSA